ncbi:MAG TPA: hypothetical protein VD931_12250 [Baekduia sp.]|nr:hypothetical protein [Baekduia sp.]
MSKDAVSAPQPAPTPHAGNLYVGPPLGRSLVKALVALAAGKPPKGELL